MVAATGSADFKLACARCPSASAVIVTFLTETAFRILRFDLHDAGMGYCPLRLIREIRFSCRLRICRVPAAAVASRVLQDAPAWFDSQPNCGAERRATEAINARKQIAARAHDFPAATTMRRISFAAIGSGCARHASLARPAGRGPAHQLSAFRRGQHTAARCCFATYRSSLPPLGSGGGST